MIQPTQINKCNTTYQQDKSHVTIYIDAEKDFDKIHNPFMKKSLKKLGLEGMYLNIIKAMCNESIDNIILNGEKNEAIFSNFGNETKMSTLSSHFSALFWNS
jgi:hypothetical protein